MTQNSLALIFGNTVTGNGTNPSSPLGRFGVLLFQSRADLIGGNTISGNSGWGIFLTESTAMIGDAGFGLPFANTISGNSTAGQTVFGPPAGIFIGLASAAVLRSATADTNTGAGVLLADRSTLVVNGSTVTHNSINGIQLGQGSMAIFRPSPLSNISGNTGTDLKCLDAESTFTGPLADSPTTNCTGF